MTAVRILTGEVLLPGGWPPHSVSAFLGHANVTTTARYLNVKDDYLQGTDREETARTRQGLEGSECGLQRSSNALSPRPPRSENDGGQLTTSRGPGQTRNAASSQGPGVCSIVTVVANGTLSGNLPPTTWMANGPKAIVVEPHAPRRIQALGW